MRMSKEHYALLLAALKTLKDKAPDMFAAICPSMTWLVWRNFNAVNRTMCAEGKDTLLRVYYNAGLYDAHIQTALVKAHREIGGFNVAPLDARYSVQAIDDGYFQIVVTMSDGTVKPMVTNQEHLYGSIAPAQSLVDRCNKSLAKRLSKARICKPRI